MILLHTYWDDVYAEVLHAHNQLYSERKIITAKAIKLRYLWEDEERMALMKAVKYHNANINNSLKPSSLKNFFSTEKYLQQFLHKRLKTDDIYLIQLNYKFIVNLENYIRTYKSMKARIRIQVSTSHNEDQIDKAIGAFSKVGTALGVAQYDIPNRFGHKMSDFKWCQ